jgi:hypothetical protein
MPDARPATLADLIAQGFGITAHCIDCGRATVLSARDLAAKLGKRCPAPAVAERLKCSECGSGRATLRLANTAAPLSPGWKARKG